MKNTPVPSISFADLQFEDIEVITQSDPFDRITVTLAGFDDDDPCDTEVTLTFYFDHVIRPETYDTVVTRLARLNALHENVTHGYTNVRTILKNVGMKIERRIQVYERRLQRARLKKK